MWLLPAVFLVLLAREVGFKGCIHSSEKVAMIFLSLFFRDCLNCFVEDSQIEVDLDN